MDYSTLTLEDRQEFDRTGFIIIHGFYSLGKIDELTRWTDELLQWPLEENGPMVYLEESSLCRGNRIVSRIEKFVDHHAGMRAVAHDSRLLDTIAALIDDQPTLFKEKINLKLPGSGGFEPHQDIQAGWDSYAPCFVSVLIAIDECTEENGCLELAAGHHRRGIIGRRWEPLVDDELDGIQFIPFAMLPGDIVIFDCFVPHGSKPNTTSHPRRNLYLTYNRATDGDHRERYFADKRKSFPPDYEREPGKNYSFRV